MQHLTPLKSLLLASALGSAGRDAGHRAGEIQGYHYLHGYRRYGAERGRRRRRRQLHH